MYGCIILTDWNFNAMEILTIVQRIILLIDFMYLHNEIIDLTKNMMNKEYDT